MKVADDFISEENADVFMQGITRRVFSAFPAPVIPHRLLADPFGSNMTTCLWRRWRFSRSASTPFST
jgi:ABC-type antimicrobial peptide transport system ATPase subunit